MAQVTSADKLRALLLLLVLSVVAGALTAALSIPTMLVGTTVVNTARAEFDQIPLDLITPPQPQASKVYMADGSLLTSFSDEYREYVPMDKISPWMQKAQVAIEDRRFYEHGAVDPIGIVRAAIGPLLGEAQRGASSITQQYVKLVRVQVAIQNNDKAAQKAATDISLSRKIIEMRYAMALEKKMTKDQILEAYLNMAYYGDQAYGVQAAAFRYFGVSAADLTLPQAAMLAGLVQAPGTTTPTKNPDMAINRRNVVLNIMAEPDMSDRLRITPAERDEAKAVPWDPTGVQSITRGCQDSRYPFICQYVEKTLIDTDKMADQLGATKEDRRNAINTGGYSIYTVIDPVAQDATQKAVLSRVDPRDPVIGAAALVQPGTGLIIAMAQSRYVMGPNKAKGETYWNYAVPNDMGGAEGFQAGSTFKIFVLLNALQMGVPYDTLYDAQSPVDYAGQVFQSCSGPVRVQGHWKVYNAGSKGVFNLLDATVASVNNYFIPLERDTSLCGSVKMAQAAGVRMAMAMKHPRTQAEGTDLIVNGAFDEKPSFTLGTIEVAPLTMAEAYATLAANGVHCDSIILKSITDRKGNDVPVPSANCQKTIEPNVVAGADVALQANMARGTGTVARFPGGWPQAGKSGTTTKASAVAFGGFTPNVAGYATIAIDKQAHWFWDGRRQSLNGLRLPYSKIRLNGTGGPDAGQIWKAMMAAASRNTPKTGFPKFTPIVTGWSSTNTATPSPTVFPSPPETITSSPPVTVVPPTIIITPTTPTSSTP